MFKLILLSVFPFITLFAQDSLTFVIRVDDVQSRNVSYLPAGITPFENAVELRGGKVTWAVIPHRLIENLNLSGGVTQQLISTLADGHEIAQHGYNHTCLRCGNTGHEYYCITQVFHHTYTVQAAMTDTALRILADSLNFRPSSFVPPGHHADSISWKVLTDQAFDIVSTTGLTKQFIYPGLYNLAPHQEFTWNMQSADYRAKMTSALSDVRLKGMRDGYYMILFHDPFIRQGYQNGLVVNWIGELLDSLKAEYGSKLRFKTLSVAAKEFRDAPSSIADGSENLNMQFKLMQNFPNPFNPSTIISFQTTNEGSAQLKVYDMLGNELATLLNGPILSGEHSVRFDAAGMASGVYFYRLTINGSTLSGKMLLGK
ncbi:MAG: DUF2334 domain-containing protein [Ignavibacteriales bacterium]|nr:DUF2334 domain-containing protein [Ignavibacteriales bacterium]